MVAIDRRALAVTLISFAATAAWEIGRGGRHPYHDLSRGHYTDHFSHVSSARLLPRAGLEIWRKPIADLLRHLTPAEVAALPPDVRVAAAESYSVPGWPKDKPVIASWSHGPRFYPPGDAVLFAPVALAYHFTSLSFTSSNLLAVLLLLVYAHVSLYFVLAAGVGLLETLLIWFPVVHWTLEGFYDAAMFTPLVLCARELRLRRGAPALLAYCAALAIHFRALFLAPWALWAAALVVSERQYATWRRREWAMIAGAAVLALVALVPFVLLQPSLRALNVSNQVSLVHGPALRAQVLAFALVCCLAGLLFWRSRAPLDLALLTWTAVLLFSLRQAEQWHALALLPWFFSPLVTPAEAVTRQTRVWFVLSASVMVFRELPAPAWLAQLF